MDVLDGPPEHCGPLLFLSGSCSLPSSLYSKSFKFKKEKKKKNPEIFFLVIWILSIHCQNEYFCVQLQMTKVGIYSGAGDNDADFDPKALLLIFPIA